jgi:CheY-like chemotaxis protein
MHAARGDSLTPEIDRLAPWTLTRPVELKGRSGMRILVIEDEFKTAKFLKKGLSEAGFVVDVAGDGLEGRYLAQKVDFELLILDAMLPDLDGWQVLTRLREAGRRPSGRLFVAPRFRAA